MKKVFVVIFALAIALALGRRIFAGGGGILLSLSYSNPAHEFTLGASTLFPFDYIFAYKTPSSIEGVNGGPITGPIVDSVIKFQRQVYAGTCSTYGTCIPHTILRGIYKAKTTKNDFVTAQLFTMNNGVLTIVRTYSNFSSQLALSYEENYWLNTGIDLLTTPTPTATIAPTATPWPTSTPYPTRTPTPTPTTIPTPTPDIVAPTINIETPVANSTVQGYIGVNARTWDNVGTIKTEFYLDGVWQYTHVWNYNLYYWSWNTNTAANGNHQLSAITYDAAGNIGRSAINITVSNPDYASPVAEFTSPVWGSALPRRSLVNASVNATDNVGVRYVEIYVNNVLICTKTSAPFSCLFETGNRKNIYYSIDAKAYDAAGNTGTAHTWATTK